MKQTSRRTFIKHNLLALSAFSFAGWSSQSFAMTKMQCDCGHYVYDPSAGDIDNDIEPGTSFDDLPEDWVCPQCGNDKDSFSVAS